VTLRYVELFAGMGGLSLGLDRAGMQCVAHVEYSPGLPRRVLRHRWPTTPLLYDVQLTHGGWLVNEYGPVDILSGGSPCQDLSVAGLREGLTGDRSVLFYEQIRVWQEVCAAQDSDCLLLWENVDGARSSNGGADFGAVLSAIVGASIAIPTDGWRSAGVAAGPSAIAAWRVLDAQFFGVPQRRSRVFIVATRTGSLDPSQVLFDAEGVPRNPSTRRKARKGITRSAGARPEGQSELFGALAFNTKQDGADASGVSPTLLGMMHRDSNANGGGQVGVLAFVQDGDGRVSAGEVTSPVLPVSERTGVGSIGVLAFDEQQITHPANRSRVEPDAPAPTLNKKGTVSVAFAFKPSHFTRGKDGAPNEVAPPLTADADKGDQDTLVYNETGHEKWKAEPIAGSLNAHEAREAHTIVVDHENAMGTIGALCAAGGKSELHGSQAVASGHVVVGTLEARHAGGFQSVQSAAAGHLIAGSMAGVPRRLMPIECERLMDWEDSWTDIPHSTAQHSTAQHSTAQHSRSQRQIPSATVGAATEWCRHKPSG
jgi:DNA-cytosine methyltransferase